MKLIILDRDGVINQESRDYIKSISEWKPIPGSLEAIGRLTDAGYVICVATNQSGVAREYFTENTLHDMHLNMQKEAAKFGGKIFKVYYCPHLPDAKCNCRKPATGMFEQIANDLKLDFKNQKFSPDLGAIFVGDSKCDVELGLKTGCRFYLTAGLGSDGDDTLTKIGNEQAKKISVFKDLSAVVDKVLE